MAKEIKRTLKTMPDTGITTNSPNDFFDLDFHFSYYLTETKGRIEEAVSELYVKLGKILDEDREAAGKPIREEALEKLDKLKKRLEANRVRIPENELKTKYKLAYKKIQKEIAELEEAIKEELPLSRSKTNQENLETIADSILLNLTEQGLTCKEAIGVMKIIDGKIRKSRSVLFEKVDKTSLKVILKEAEN